MTTDAPVTLWRLRLQPPAPDADGMPLSKLASTYNPDIRPPASLEIIAHDVQQNGDDEQTFAPWAARLVHRPVALDGPQPGVLAHATPLLTLQPLPQTPLQLGDFAASHDPDLLPGDVLLFTEEAAGSADPPSLRPDTVIHGDIRTLDVHLDRRRLDPRHSQAVYNHSPSGFNWGYGGSGPAQLALALLLLCSPDEKHAVRAHQALKRDLIETLPQGRDFTLAGRAVLDWLSRWQDPDTP